MRRLYRKLEPIICVIDRSLPYDKEILERGLLVGNPLKKTRQWIGEKEGGYKLDYSGKVSRESEAKATQEGRCA